MGYWASPTCSFCSSVALAVSAASCAAFASVTAAWRRSTWHQSISPTAERNVPTPLCPFAPLCLSTLDFQFGLLQPLPPVATPSDWRCIRHYRHIKRLWTAPCCVMICPHLGSLSSWPVLLLVQQSESCCVSTHVSQPWQAPDLSIEPHHHRPGDHGVIVCHMHFVSDLGCIAGRCQLF